MRGRVRWTPVDAATDIFRVKQYFGVLLELRDWARSLGADAGFVDLVRRAVLPVPGSGPPRAPAVAPLPLFRSGPPGDLAGKRVAVVSSGGSGALASLVGVARVLEESGTPVGCWSLCSGGALFGFPLAAGRSADEVAELVLDLTARDLVDVDWWGLTRALARRGRGLTGVVRGERIEDTCRRLVGDLTLGDLPVPAYAPIWNVEQNRVEYLGPRTYPRVRVATAIRLALALPPVFEPVPLDGYHWCDGGIVDILPVHPVLDLEEPPEVVLAVNCFHPPGLRGEDATGWEDQPLSILQLAGQVRSSQHVQLARENLARLRSVVPDVRLVEPVPYDLVRGTGFYRQFLDPTDWPSFIRAGYDATHVALRSRPAQHAGTGPSADTSRGSSGWSRLSLGQV